MYSSELQSKIKTISTSDGSKTLVSASTFNRVARAVKNFSIDGGTISMNPAGGIHLQVIPASTGGGGGGSYSGPFAVAAENGAITIAAGHIVAGTATVAVTQGALAGTGTVYLSLTYSNGAYSYTLAIGTPPAQSASTAVYRLATVEADGTVTQIQYGDICVAGRIVA